ncbi:TIGR04063 family PEP-CTERM/XrtA system glycosyltransferase [Aestuariispira insulae]|uniref:PEP-CTERM/exosortase A-associated glycosyltransferase n=1 Tax=Aestuariispira insulae TaxID=1461337 RepID=A0A3D9HKR0_9PROT|nr:TIGR04063 family PEP-CTERM/XrtA system glycosyltransferase [Aestuariispira insulae]RED49881.1 PEP-CTERM/exosortase A-associated glycosyltransferase [Aestuariispira insulae]
MLFLIQEQADGHDDNSRTVKRSDMRILHILDHSIPLHSGYTFRTLSILREQRRRGWETFHLTGPKHTQDYVPRETVPSKDGDWEFYRTPAPDGFVAKLPVLGEFALMNAMTRRLDEVIQEVKPDILHAHSPALNGIPALRAGKKHGIPVVYEIRAFWEDAAVSHGTCRAWGPRYRLTRALETYVLRNVNAATTICEGLRQDIIERNIPAEKLTVIPNAIDLNEFPDRQVLRDPKLVQDLGLEGKLVLGFIGSFYEYEGLDLLLDAFPAIKKEIPEATILMVGGGQAEQALRDQAKSLGIEQDIIFTGRVPHDVVDQYYALVDILAYPRHSMRLTETVTPLKPLEAMAQRRIFIASDVGGHKELIDHGRTGTLFQAGNAEALATELVALARKRDDWPAIGTAGRQYVEDVRNWANSVSNYEGVYGALLAKS